MSSGSYEEALSIMFDYIEPVDQYGKNFEKTDVFGENINI